MESSNQFLGTERIGKLMQKYAIPCIISLLVGALYNIVDQIFIANASYLGSYGNALAGEEATDYLYEMGHRRIAYFGVSNAMLFSAERRRGYQMSLLKHGITPRENCCPPPEV